MPSTKKIHDTKHKIKQIVVPDNVFVNVRTYNRSPQLQSSQKTSRNKIITNKKSRNKKIYKIKHNKKNMITRERYMRYDMMYE